MTSLCWVPEQTPEELYPFLRTIGEKYPIKEGLHAGHPILNFSRVECEGQLVVSTEGKSIKLRYHTLAQAARGVGCALANLGEESQTNFRSLGIMLDCSRNAVMKVSHLKSWMCRMSLMGYNMMMLYTEDTYQLPDEPFFGFQRGAYSMDEIKELDQYAKKLGIELIGCIQTLGHMEKTLRWPAYAGLKDTSGVMLVDGDETYRLINKMLDFWSEALSTRRLHVGMDETQGLGTGRFKERFGEQDPSLIYSRHLAKVKDLCVDKGLKPMIWSDMIFSLKGGHADDQKRGQEDLSRIRSKVPEGTDLVHWDYYHEDKESYLTMLERHRKIGIEPLMASGIWTWSRLWYDHEQTCATVVPCIEACRELNIKELFFTMWGDGGAFCEFDSAMAGLIWTANLAYNRPDERIDLCQRFRAICEDDLEAYLLASSIQGKGNGYHKKEVDPNAPLKIHGPAILFDDPLYGRHHDLEKSEYWDQVEARYQGILKGLNEIEDSSSRPLAHARALIKVLLSSINIKRKLRLVRGGEPRALLWELKETELPSIIVDYKALAVSFRKQWMDRNKPEGFEGIQNMLSTVLCRYEECLRAVEDLLEGKCDHLPGLMPVT